MTLSRETYSNTQLKECYTYQPQDDITTFEIAKIIPFLIVGFEQTKKNENGRHGSSFLIAKQGIRISKELFEILPEGLARHFHFSKFDS